MTPKPDTGNPSRGVAAGQPKADSFPPEVLDWSVLCDRCLGNIDLVQRVLEKFEQQLPQELAELEHALALSDTEQVARVAHRIKGSSANVSAEGLQQAAEEVEGSSRAGCVADIPRHFDRLRSEWELYRDCAARRPRRSMALKQPDNRL
jgi:HPt (histidine-containing phosphotransfer) domain-containing protein